MLEGNKRIVRRRYAERLERFGAGIEALASGTPERRDIRYSVLHDVGVKNQVGILDVGCGFADFYHYCQELGLDISYAGVDVVPELIDRAKADAPALDLQVRDIQEQPFEDNSFDFVICSQVFNYRFEDGSNLQLVEEMLEAMLKVSRVGVAVDFLTKYVDFEEDHLFYYQPERLFTMAKKLARNVVLRHDYPLYEFCLYIYKD